MKIAFYKGSGTIFDKLIRLWTWSKYSHVELVADNIWYTSSPRDDGVVKREIDYDPDHWDMFELNIHKNKEIIDFIDAEMGKRYDWLGIFLSQIIKLNIHNPNRWFCSEIVHKAIQAGGFRSDLGKSNGYSPGKLYCMLMTYGVLK
jgi:hypothetical protein